MQVSPSPLIDDVAAVYHLAPLHALPSFDAAVTLKHSLPTRVHHAFDRLLRRRRWLWRLLYFLGLTYRFVGMALPLRMGGGWWLLLSPLAQLLPVAFTVLSLRREFLSLMVRTFDFWFFGLVNTLSLIGFWLAFRDARAVLLPLGLVEIGNARLSDAHCGSNIMPFIVIIAAVGTVYYGGLAAAVSLHLAEIHSTPLWRTPRGLVMTSEDVLVNSTVTLALLLARLAYRKRDALRSTRGDKSMVQCISYRCRLKFVAGRDTRSATRSKREDARVQLLAVVGSRLYDALDCVLGRQTWGASTGQRWFWWWKLAVLVAITLSLFHCTRAVVQGLAREPLTRVARALLVANAAANIAAVLPLFVFQQRRLVARIYSCFDIVFLVAQIFLASLVVCYLFHWALEPVVVQLGVCLWLCVVATSDALSPLAKRAFGLTARRLAVLVLLLVLAQVLLVADLAFFGRFGVVDRPLVGVAIPVVSSRRRLAVFAMPFLFSRVLTIVVWCLQVFWRLYKASDPFAELVLLQGSVQFERPDPRRRLHR